MSGVAGADRVKSRADFDHFIQDYKRLISLFPGFVSMTPSGSYNSNPNKQDFGDIDLIVHIKSDLDKAQVKKQLQAFFTKEPETKIVPFSSEKHAGKRTYNAGELVSVRYHDDELGYSAQIDNIIALDQSEASFKQSFLDMPAEKQGLILGLVKIAAIETDPQILFKKLGITAPLLSEPNEEYEFNLSSVELQLRKVTYKPGTYEQLGREIIWTSRDYDDLSKLLYQYDINASFDDLLAQSKQIIKNPRSNNRMQGVFNSMITVKSGEVGTAKGAGKIAASQKVAQTFGENKTYGRLFDALVRNISEDTLVFTFGRFQIPTNGHAVLIKEVKDIAAKYHAPYSIFVSKTVGDTTAKKYKNPLTIAQKMPYITRAFPGVNFVPCNNQMSTIIDIAQYINQKYKKIVMVAGKDRMEGPMNFKSLLEERNGIDFQFDDMQFETVSRDPDSESSSSMKEFVKQDNWQAFRNDLPRTLDDKTAEQLWSELKAALAPVPRKKPVRKNANATENNDGSGSYAVAKPGFSGQGRYADQSRADQGFNIGEAMKLNDLYNKQGVVEGFNSKQEVIDYFVNRGKSAASGASAWDRGWRGNTGGNPVQRINGVTVPSKPPVKSPYDTDKDLEEKWSAKYKNSINCSHPKGFSQKAHCAGKKKHSESIEMEQVCPDCGMCKTHGNLNEIKKGQKDSNGYTSCWKGYHAAGTKKSSTTGKQVRNCVKNEDIEEIMAGLISIIESKYGRT